MRLVLQRAVEEEVDEWLGRARYARRTEAAPGKRNGYRPRRIQTGEGEIVVELPQVRDACAPFTSKLFRGRKRFLASEPLQALVIGGFVRGLSMRDVESLCEEAGLGQVSKSTASRLCRELKERFHAFRERDLSSIRLVCLFLDAIFLPVRPSGAKEGVLCAWGITDAGERVLLDVSLGMREAEQDWLELGRSLTRRGLPAPLLVLADGAPGLVNAIEQLWPEADRQRCTVHRLRNVLAKLPERERERVKAAYWRALDEASSQLDGERRLRTLVGELADAGYSAAAACLADDLEALTVHLRYPRKHRRVWRSTNLLERSLGEVKRRTKVIGRFPGETSCLSLCWAVLDLVIAGANRVRFDELDRQLTARIATEQNRDEEQEVVAA
jgi:transposase-like protein